jgi:hypothetical protein
MPGWIFWKFARLSESGGPPMEVEEIGDGAQPMADSESTIRAATAMKRYKGTSESGQRQRLSHHNRRLPAIKKAIGMDGPWLTLNFYLAPVRSVRQNTIVP